MPINADRNYGIDKRFGAPLAQNSSQCQSYWDQRRNFDQHWALIGESSHYQFEEFVCLSLRDQWLFWGGQFEGDHAKDMLALFQVLFSLDVIADKDKDCN